MLFLGRTVLILAALALVTGSWPRFLAGLGEMGPESIYRDNKQERSVAGNAYERALLSLRRSKDLNPASSIYYAQSADVSLRNAMRLAEDGKFKSSKIEFDNSRVDAKRGLLRGPSDPYAWFVLAYSEQAIDGPSEAALSALNTSFDVGETEGKLLIPRISWCFGYWSALPENLRRRAKGQIQLALKNDSLRRDLAQYAASLPSTAQEELLGIVEEVGSGGPDNLRKFRYWLRISKSDRGTR